MKSSSFHKDRLILFLTGCALGAVCFLWVYGYKILNPVYDAWLFNTEIDLSQHYIGFCHYRMSDWHFPLGMIDTLSYPTSMSVIYTDSIPLFALLFKLFRGILPLHFQYFGIFGILSFMLMGGLSSLLVYSLIPEIESLYDKKSDGRIPFFNRNLPYVLSLIASVVYIMSFTVLQRMFYHTALGAQWIIILALFIWVNRDNYSRRGTLTAYSFMGLLCVGIHTYYVPMVGSILLAASVERIVKSRVDMGPEGGLNGYKKERENDKRIRSGLRSIVAEEAVNILGFCITGLLTLFVFGAFNGPSGGYDEGLGSFTSNLNTFINPIYGSVILKPMKLYYDFQYEGYGYLGIGVIMLTAVALVYLVKNIKKAGFKRYFREHVRAAVFVCLLMVDCALAVLPMVTFSDKKLFGIPLPSFIRKAAGIFRSNGRFIWVPVYLIFTGVLVCTIRLLSGKFGRMEKGKGIVVKILLVLVLFQVLDTTKAVADKQRYFVVDQAHENVWDDLSLPDKPGERYKEFAFLYNENDILMDTAFFAYLNGMRLNNFYYARDIDDAVNFNIEGWKSQLNNGTVRDDCVYICRKDDDIAGMIGGLAGKPGEGSNLLTWYELDEEHLAGVSDKQQRGSGSL